MSINIYRPENQAGGEEAVFSEMSNFLDVNSSYSDFMVNSAILNDGGFFPEEENGPAEGERWSIQSRRELGLNVFCHVYITRPRGDEFTVALPWRAQEVCQNCQGQGEVYSWNSDNSAYEAIACEDCGGSGSYSYDSEISLLINDALCGQPVIRKRKAGRLDPRLGQRGDLIINVTWVDQLPPLGETVN